MKINKKLKLLLPILFGGIAIATVAPVVVSCSSDDSSTEPPQMELIPVDNQDQVWAKVQPIIEDYYTPEKAQQDIETFIRDYFTSANSSGLNLELKELTVKVEKTNPNDKNTVGTYNITFNTSWTEIISGEQPKEHILNQEGVNVEIKPVLIRDKTDKNIIKVSYYIQMINPPFVDESANPDIIKNNFVETKPTEQPFTIHTNIGYLKGTIKSKQWVAGKVYDTYDDAMKSFLDDVSDPDWLLGFIVDGKSLPISAEIAKGASGDQNNPTPPHNLVEIN